MAVYVLVKGERVRVPRDVATDPTPGAIRAWLQENTDDWKHEHETEGEEVENDG